LKYNLFLVWGLGIGDWGLGIGPIHNPQSPIPNPQTKNKLYFKKFIILFLTNKKIHKKSKIKT